MDLESFGIERRIIISYSFKVFGGDFFIFYGN